MRRLNGEQFRGSKFVVDEGEMPAWRCCLRSFPGVSITPLVWIDFDGLMGFDCRHFCLSRPLDLVAQCVLGCEA